jgi:hypothetical protein
MDCLRGETETNFDSIWMCCNWQLHCHTICDSPTWEELFYHRLVQCWHVSSASVSNVLSVWDCSWGGIYCVLPAPGKNGPWGGTILIESRVWAVWSSTLECLARYFIFCVIALLLLWRNNFDSGWHVNCNAILPCLTDPTHELFDPWHLPSWHASSPTVS